MDAIPRITRIYEQEMTQEAIYAEAERLVCAEQEKRCATSMNITEQCLFKHTVYQH